MQLVFIKFSTGHDKKKLYESYKKLDAGYFSKIVKTHSTFTNGSIQFNAYISRSSRTQPMSSVYGH